uniref:GNAT family N-acetyltransferase n=1 Tax=Paractinoplanes polyasparticus TaxID=2856853 RepID=UPI001C85284E|nr:GNAT family N-acetyltransferase [Actinoplanes polyasparticus]
MTTGQPVRWSRAGDPEEIVFVPRRTDHPDAAALLDAFFQEQVGRYGFAESVDLDPDIYDEPNGLFVVVYQDDRPVGCGGCRRFEQRGDTFEIKKTYLIPEARGCGLGRQLLDMLEDAAVGWGARRTILETGVRNVAALRLFTSNGYVPIARYVASRDPEINRAFEKDLTGSSHRLTPDGVQQATV